MAEGDSVIKYSSVLIFAIGLSTPILHGFGMFGKEWVTATSCEALNYKPVCCNRTMYSNHSICHGPFGLEDLNQVVYVIQVTVFCLLICLSSAAFLSALCCGWDANSVCATYKTTFFLYLVAGLLCLIGCMVFDEVYSKQSFKKTFTICVVSGVYDLVFGGMLLCLLLSKRQGKDVKLVKNNEAARLNEDV